MKLAPCLRTGQVGIWVFFDFDDSLTGLLRFFIRACIMWTFDFNKQFVPEYSSTHA